MNNEMLIRTTKYYRTLNRLKSIGLERVFAHNLADAAGVSAEIVRKDFSLLSVKGQKKGGYDINDLIRNLSSILGKGGDEDVIIVGCGRIGKALMHYSGFETDGIRIVAGFDTDPSVYSAPQSVPVYPMSKLSEMVPKLNVKVAVLSVPESAASDTAEKLIAAGIRGILNFTPITLRSQEEVVVHNINIGLEIEQIFYELRKFR